VNAKPVGSCEEPAGNAEKLDDKVGKIGLLYTSCTTMLLKVTSTEDFGTLCEICVQIQGDKGGLDQIA
jgi:hypothetical protein